MVTDDAMTLRELVNRARDRHFEQVAAAIARARSLGNRVFVEPCLRNSDGELVYDPSGLQTPLRLDMLVAGGDGQRTRVDFDSVTIQFGDPVYAIWGTLRLEMRKLCWADVQLVLRPRIPEVDWQPLRSWFLKWFDLEDARPPSTTGCFEVVHFLSDPEEVESAYRLLVDMGSAPSDALGELFDCLAASGFTECVIGV